MPTRLAAPVFSVDAAKMHKIDTRNVENLFSMWTVFNKCAESMEEGRRLENLSWRLWTRETLCCESKPQFPYNTIDLNNISRPAKDTPSLSSSLDSLASEDYEIARTQTRSPPIEIKTLSSGKNSIESFSSSRVRARHISSQALEKMVVSIKETKINQKDDMTALPSHVVEAVQSTTVSSPPSSPTASSTTSTRGQITPVADLRTAPAQIRDPRASHSSTSTALLSSPESEAASSQTSASEISIAPVLSPGVVRGFTPTSISIHRTPSHMSPVPSAIKPSPMKSCLRAKPEMSAKGANFMLGGSSEDESSSIEDRVSAQTSKSPSIALQKPQFDRKVTSFDEEIQSRRISNMAAQDEDVFEDSEEEDSEIDADDNEDDDEDWEDSEAEESRPASPAPMFKRVDSKPNLVSRRSLLTTMVHESERANALAGLAAIKSQPNLQRSRISTPNGPSLAGSPDDEVALEMPQTNLGRSKPVNIVPPKNNMQSALSPRTTRRNMLATELTESLRKHLLWERQQKNTTANAVLKRRHTAHDNMANLQNYPQLATGTGSKNNSWNHNNYFDHGDEYHQKGW